MSQFHVMVVGFVRYLLLETDSGKSEWLTELEE
jgi:hypothetical protein